jgi:hypothetical protein
VPLDGPSVIPDGCSADLLVNITPRRLVPFPALDFHHYPRSSIRSLLLIFTPSARFHPVIPAIKRLQTYARDSTATGSSLVDNQAFSYWKTKLYVAEYTTSITDRMSRVMTHITKMFSVQRVLKVVFTAAMHSNKQVWLTHSLKSIKTFCSLCGRMESWDSSFAIVTRLRAGQPRTRGFSPGRGKRPLLPKRPEGLWSPLRLIIN